MIPQSPDALLALEDELLRLVAAGYTDAAAAKVVRFSTRTVKTHLHRLQQQYGTNGRAALVAAAVRVGRIN